jgi:hypothetical protein
LIVNLGKSHSLEGTFVRKGRTKNARNFMFCLLYLFLLHTMTSLVVLMPNLGKEKLEIRLTKID